MNASASFAASMFLTFLVRKWRCLTSWWILLLARNFTCKNNSLINFTVFLRTLWIYYSKFILFCIFVHLRYRQHPVMASLTVKELVNYYYYRKQQQKRENLTDYFLDRSTASMIRQRLVITNKLKDLRFSVAVKDPEQKYRCIGCYKRRGNMYRYSDVQFCVILWKDNLKTFSTS